MDLDPHTLSVLASLVGVALSLAFTLLWRLLKRPGLGWWALAWWLGSLATALAGLDGGPWLLLRYGLRGLSDAFLWLGVAASLGLPFRWRAPSIVVAGFLLATLLLQLCCPDRSGLAVMGLQEAFWDLWALWLLLKVPGPQAPAARNFAAAVFGLDALVFAVRTALPVLSPSGVELLQSRSGIVFGGLFAILMALAFSVALLLLALHRRPAD